MPNEGKESGPNGQGPESPRPRVPASPRPGVSAGSATRGTVPISEKELGNGDSPQLKWTSWPVRDEPPSKTAVLALLIGMTVAMAWMQAPYYGILGFVLMMLLLAPYFLPCRFEVSSTGVKVFFPMFNRDRPWSTYKRYVVRKDGVFLSPFDKPSRLDSYRGDFLRFSAATDREQVIALVRKHVGVK